MEYIVQQMFRQNTWYYIYIWHKHIFYDIVRPRLFLKYRLNLEMKLGITLQRKEIKPFILMGDAAEKHTVEGI